MCLKKYMNQFSCQRNDEYFHVAEARLLESVLYIHSARPDFNCRETAGPAWTCHRDPELLKSHDIATSDWDHLSLQGTYGPTRS